MKNVLSFILTAAIVIGLGSSALIPGSHSAPALQSKIPPWMKKARGEFMDKWNAVKQDDPNALVELGDWARKAGLDGAAQAMYYKATKIDSNHEKARTAAGYVKQGESWVRDYMPLAKKIRVKYEGGAGSGFKKFLDDPQFIAGMLKQIDEKGGMYRGPDDVEIEITLKGHASGVGVTTPVSAMGNSKAPPPFLSTIVLDASALGGGGGDTFRKALTHEMTHAFMGAVQIFIIDREAEGYASYVGDDATSAYAKFKSHWRSLASKYSADKVREWGRLIADEWVFLWDKNDIPAAAYEQVFGKKF